MLCGRTSWSLRPRSGGPHVQGGGSEGQRLQRVSLVIHGQRNVPAVVQFSCMLLVEGLGTMRSIVISSEGLRGLALCPGVASKPQGRPFRVQTRCKDKTGLWSRKPPSQGSLSLPHGQVLRSHRGRLRAAFMEEVSFVGP